MRRAAGFVLWCAVAAGLASGTVGGCSSDPDSPLGAEFIDDGLIGTRPGRVFQDTVVVSSGDTTFVVSALMAAGGTLTLGRKGGIETSMLLKFDFSNAGSDTLLQVERAVLSLRVTSSSQTDSINARFFELANPLSESEKITSLDLAGSPIPDSSLVVVDRAMRFFPSSYQLPKTLVQDWIRGDAPHTGIAIVLSDTTTTKQLTYGARENVDSGLRPFLTAFFTDGSTTRFNPSDDATFVKVSSTSPELRLSDGLTRRVFIPVDLTGFSTELLLHEAALTLSIVPGSSQGGDLSVLLYAPLSSDVNNSGILTGLAVTNTFLTPESGIFRVSVRNIIANFIAQPSTNHGLVLQYAIEGTEIRQIDFFSGGAVDSLRPRIDLTFSEAPDFAK